MFAFNPDDYDIIENERIVHAYEMQLDPTRISASRATVQFAPAEVAEQAGTRRLFTEQAVFLDAFDDAGSRSAAQSRCGTRSRPRYGSPEAPGSRIRSRLHAGDRL